MKKYLLLASVVLTSAAVGGAYAAIDCSTPPSCSELGYDMTASECGSAPKLRCPFGEAYFCEPTSAGEETPTEAKIIDCSVGKVMYDDYNCYSGFPTDHYPVAFIVQADTVASDDTKKGMAIAIEESYKKMWGSLASGAWNNSWRIRVGGTNENKIFDYVKELYGNTDSGLGNCTTENYDQGEGGLGAECSPYFTTYRGCQWNAETGDFLGTTVKVSEYITTGCETLGLCNTYHPWIQNRAITDFDTQAGKKISAGYFEFTSFVPSAKELKKLADIRTVFKETLADLEEHYSSFSGQAPEASGCYWTSNEVDAENALAVNFDSGKVEAKNKESTCQIPTFFFYGSDVTDDVIDINGMCNFKDSYYPPFNWHTGD